MEDINTTLLIFKYVIPVLIAIIGYLLGLGVYWLKKMSNSLDDIKETVIKHSVHVEDFEKRIDRLEKLTFRNLTNGIEK